MRLVATEYVFPSVSAARIDGAGLSPQLTATTMRFPARLLAWKVCAIVPDGVSLDDPAA